MVLDHLRIDMRGAKTLTSGGDVVPRAAGNELAGKQRMQHKHLKTKQETRLSTYRRRIVADGYAPPSVLTGFGLAGFGTSVVVF